MSFRTKLIEKIRTWVAPGVRAFVIFSILRFVLGLASPRKKVSLDNLSRAFPERDIEWCKKTVKRMYSHFSWMAVEYLALLNNPLLSQEWVTDVEGESVLQSLKDDNRGCVILTAHIGNWELLSAWLCQRGYPLYAAVRDPSADDLADLMESYRRHIGLKTLRKDRGGLKEMVKMPQEGAFMGLVADQDGGPLGMSVEFLGRPCTMPMGPAAISVMAKVPIVPVTIRRIKPFQHKIEIGQPLNVPVKGRRKEKTHDLCLDVNRVLEDMVRANPDEWLWMHRRWKTVIS